VRWVAEAITVVGLLSAIVDLGARLQAKEATVEVTRESCGDAVSQLARFAAECADRCMGE